MIDFRWKTFLAVIEEGTLARAGVRLGLTQPAVSQHIKALEEYYNQPLFDHKGRNLVLNDAGRLVQKVTEELSMAERHLEKELSGFIAGQNRFHLGATLTIGEFILPAYLGEYYKNFPNRDLTIEINNTMTILDQLKNGNIDLAVVEGPTFSFNGYSRLFMQDEMIFIGTDRYFEDNDSPIDMEILKKSRLILREMDSGTRYYWEEYKNKNEIISPNLFPIMEVGSLSAIKSLVEAGYGCSVMSRKAVDKELTLGSLTTRPFSWGPLFRELKFVYTDNSPLSFVEEFTNFCSHYSSQDFQ